MRTMFSIGVAVLCGIVAGASLAQAGDEVNQAWATQSLTSMPLTFTQNMGQWDEQVLFRANAGGATMWITGEGVVYQFVRTVDDPATDATAVFDKADAVTPDFETLIVKTLFVGANVRPSVAGDREMGYKCNYFHGSDPAKWRSNVPNFEAIVLDEVYPGIDLTYYGNGQRMEYDFVVSPGADFSRIQIKYEGAESIAVAADGSLSVTTAWGEIKELTPVVYQNVNGERRAVTAEYAVGADNTFGFSLGKDYDRTLPVTIDPELDYSTYLGGSGYEIAFDIALDAAGATYVTGTTSSTNFPTVNQYQANQADLDVFVSKLSSGGVQLLYSTYIGGTYIEKGYGIAVDATGAAYITGETTSSDFPTPNPPQSYQGGTDAFVTKLSADGDSLAYSFCHGGTALDKGLDIAIYNITGWNSATPCITGRTESSNFPAGNGFQSSYQGGAADAFVSRFSIYGGGVFSTYLGGTYTDVGYGVDYDDSGYVYVTGSSSSTNFPLANEYQSAQGQTDAFVTKFAGTGGSPVYSTYLGGTYDDWATDIAVDQREAFVTGITYSANFPDVNGEGNRDPEYCDAFVSKFANTGDSLIYSRQLYGGGYWGGGHCVDEGYDIAVDSLGAAYVCGIIMNGTYGNGFVTRLSTAGAFQLYYDVVEGSAYDMCFGIAVGNNGVVYVAGATASTDFPTLDAYEDSYAGGDYDAFLIKFEDASCCLDRVGDANQSGDDEPTIGDVSAMIDAKFISGYCPGILDCLLEADINQSGGSDPTCDDVSIGDIQTLIAYLNLIEPVPVLQDCVW